MALPAPVPDDLVVVMLKCSSAVLIVQIFEGFGPVPKCRCFDSQKNFRLLLFKASFFS
jgi:hypothetical protein